MRPQSTWSNYDKELQDGRLMGSLDANMDGKIEKSELKGLLGKHAAAEMGSAGHQP